jgi:limonene-1,2-epoxide hydrolase
VAVDRALCREPEVPHPSRLAGVDPWWEAVIAAHGGALAAGEPGYRDPATGLFVFTAATLAARGSCCGSGCRHCPYIGAVTPDDEEETMGTVEARNKQVVERYWDAHFRRDWAAMATFFTPTAHYTDVGVDGVGATGPGEIVARLRLGIEPLEGYHHFPKHMVGEGDLVVTEHVEQWRFHTGEVIDHPFTSVMEVEGGLIRRWHDYSHIGNLVEHAPAWWLERIAGGWRDLVTAPGDAPD